MTLEMLVILALAAWRVAHLLVNERGVLGIGERVRALAGVHQVEVEHELPNGQTFKTMECQARSEIGKALCCIYCTAFWTSGGVLVLWCIGTGLHPSLAEAVVHWLAIAALSMFAEKINRYV